MPETHYLIIGNGPAGREAAITLREKDPAGRITVLTKEDHGYFRPRLLPDYIAGLVTLDEVLAEPFRDYDRTGIKLRTGQSAARLDLENRVVVLRHREVIPFTGLILTVGGRPRIPEPLLVFEDLMLTLKTPADARKWIERLAGTDSVLIIGGDLTSFAMVRALLQMDKKVSFVFSEEAFWPMRPTKETFDAAAEKLTAQGVHVVPGRLHSVAKTAGDRYEVTTNFERVETGLVGAFFGLVPDVRFLAGSGLRIERGILVDECLSTGFDGVYAAGDCAQVYHPDLRAYWVSIGYENARKLGRIAAVNLAGGREKAQAEPSSIFCDQGVRANTSWWMEFRG